MYGTEKEKELNSLFCKIICIKNILATSHEFMLSYSWKNEINESAVWVDPSRVCVVEYMPNILQSLRQPVFKGVRDDILPEEVQDNVRKTHVCSSGGL